MTNPDDSQVTRDIPIGVPRTVTGHQVPPASSPLPAGYWPPQPPVGIQPSKKRKKRRVFMWFFLVVQAIFIIWLIVGLATVHTGPTHADLVAGCYHGAWQPLFKSQADCVKHYGGALNDAGTAGKAIGVGLVIALWVAVDVILGVTYMIYRLATRNR